MFPGKEWISNIFYSYDGSILDPDNLVLRLEDVALQSIDESGTTKYRDNKNYLTSFMMEDVEKRMGEWKYGLLHSHHNMKVFFSGTDEDELKQGAPDHSIYLSLIVNNKMDFEARISVHLKNEYKTKDVAGDVVSMTDESIGWWPIQIKYVLGEIPEYLNERIAALIEERKSRPSRENAWINQEPELPEIFQDFKYGSDEDEAKFQDIAFLNEWIKKLSGATQAPQERLNQLADQYLKELFPKYFGFKTPEEVRYQPLAYIQYLLDEIDDMDSVNEKVRFAMSNSLTTCAENLQPA